MFDLAPNRHVRLACTLALTCDIMLGPYALRWMGYNYASYGGHAFAKIHPGTYVTLVALALYIVTLDHPLRAIGRLMAQSPALSLYCLCMTIVSGYVLCIVGLADVPRIVDSFLAPGLLAVILVNASQPYRRFLVNAMIGLLVINAIAGIWEAHAHVRLFPFISDGREYHEDYFRATAFAGHPLRNALLTSLAFMVLPSCRWPRPLAGIVLAVLGLGLLAFGGRVSLVVGLAGCLLTAAWECRAAVRQNPPVFIRLALLSSMALIAVLACLGALLALTNFGQRIYAEDLAGSSSLSRWQLFQIFNMIDLNSLIAGYQSETIDAMAHSIGLVTIENFWLNLLILLGFAGYVIWLPGFLAGHCSVWRQAGFTGRVLVLTFLLMASSTNGLAKKGTIMSVGFAFAICIGAHERRAATDAVIRPGSSQPAMA
jgi:hypothetical protein